MTSETRPTMIRRLAALVAVVALVASVVAVATLALSNLVNILVASVGLAVAIVGRVVLAVAPWHGAPARPRGGRRRHRDRRRGLRRR